MPFPEIPKKNLRNPGTHNLPHLHPLPPAHHRTRTHPFLVLVLRPVPNRRLAFHSLMTSVANFCTSRGDISGSHRDHLIAEKLESELSLGFFGPSRTTRGGI
ncbi:hypothetical protein SO802_008008 [Lithocarpus litseifolius]|uniref:Uncharacterized protein n=1 Tax=Lithocarpus litseifolius TaxID=425828 RepID=A0AAW2DQA2_9ROSI